MKRPESLAARRGDLPTNNYQVAPTDVSIHAHVNGQVERLNRTIKDATVKRFHYENHDQLRSHLADFVTAYNLARRLGTLKGLTPYGYICKLWTKEPDRFTLDPLHKMPGLNMWAGGGNP